MDYRHIAINTLADFAEEHEDMSLGELLYSFLRGFFEGEDFKIIKKLRGLDNEELYIAIEEANNYEKGK